MSSLLDHLIVPVVVIDDAARAAEVATALADGGIGCAEVTLRTAAGLAAIRAMADTGRLLVGAGTVIHPDDVARVADAGARFVVSPGLDPEIVAACAVLGLECLPGVATASEVQRAVRLGLDRVKFFPADRLGGLGTIAALAGPFPSTGFVPSGGVSLANLAEYLAHPSVPAVSGSWMATRASIAAGDYDSIVALSREAVLVAAS
jgi:2-dehydro-3-deoxyphosphogluconate aldolase/(4S)-4-hydroxy-2-oxoglutarate aldolase